MAAKVNTKFVVMLAGALVLVFAGVAGTYLWLKTRSGDENERKGDVAMAAGNYEEAEKLYSKAVNRQQNNAVRLTKWRSALEKMTPKTQTVYEQKYLFDFTKATRNLAILKRDDVAAHRQWLQLLEDRIVSQKFDSQPNVELVTEVDNALGNFDKNKPGPEQALRRYSARALVRLISNSPDVTDTQFKRAREDIDAALKADPADVETAIIDLGLQGALIGKAMKDRKPEEEKTLREELRRKVDDLAAKFPDHPEVVVTVLRSKVERILSEAGLTAELSDEERRARSVAAEAKYRALSADLDAATPKLEAAKVLSANVLGEFSQLETSIDPKANFARTIRIASKQVEARPNDMMMHNILASSYGQTGKYEESLTEYQKIVDLPMVPLSIDGLRLFTMKSNAAIQQADIALQEWFIAEDAAAKGPAMEKAKAYRAKLTSMGVKDDVPSVIFVDAKTKVALEDWAAANKLMTRFFDALGSDRYPDALLVHAQIFLRLNQPGAALTTAQKLIAMEPNNTTAIKLFAKALYAMEDKDRALEALKVVLDNVPDDAEAKQLQAAWQQAKDPTTITDPALRELTQLQQGTSAADRAALGPQLEALAAKYNQDPRIAMQLAQLLVEKQDKDGAAAAVKKSLAAHPDSEELKRLDRALAAEDTVAALVKLVDDAPVSAEERVLRKYAILRGYRRNDEASQLLKAEMVKYPSDARLLELAFLEAIDRKDLDAANAMADQAAKIDADAAEGLTFRARVYIVQDRLSEAAATLRQATSKRASTPEAWRLLARVLAKLGRSQDASKAYEEALKLRPNDREILRELVTYLEAQDPQKALAIARDASRFADTDPGFEDLWLRLEGKLGDKNLAIERRKKIQEKDPENVNNMGALATLYLDLKDYRTARDLIDKIKTKKDSVAIVLLDARWNLEQRAPDQARKAMEDYIERQDKTKLTMDPFLAFGQFLVQRGQADEGLALMQRGAPYQNPKTCEVDRTLGDTLAMLGREEAAAQAYERVLAAGGDDMNSLVRLRLAEMYLRLRRCDKADELLTRISAGTQKENATAMLLAADGADCVGDSKRSHDILDRAVSTFPDDPLVYVKRAEFLVKDAGLERDALSDLDAALRIKPGYARALQVRSALYLAKGDDDKATADLMTLVRANPQMEDIRNNLITDLMRRGKRDEAVQLADETISQRPGDAQTMARMSDLFRVNEQWADGARYAMMAWGISKEYDFGIRALEGLLNDPSGNTAQAEDVLRTFQAEISQRPALLIARAKLLAKRNANNFARVQKQVSDDLSAALELIPAERFDQFLAWRKDVRRIFPKGGDCLAYYTDVSAKSVHRDWVLYFRVDLLLSDPAAFEQGVTEATALAGSASNDNIRVLTRRLVGSAYLSKGEFQKAVDSWLVGIKEFPDDWEMNNNVAFVLAKNLNRVADAVPYAETAVKGNPTSADALDTLGWIYLKAGKMDEAKKMLEQAVARAGASYARISCMIHLGSYYAAVGDKAAVARIMKDSETLIRAIDKEQATGYQTELDELKKQIEGK